jgi:hypothetical protein
MKRKCGTCKYFEDRGVANSGVCQHAQRRELRDVVLVRQSELACRNSWDQDLWEPGPDFFHEPINIEDAEVDSVVADAMAGRRRHEEIFGGSESVPMLSPYGEAADRVTGFEYGGLGSTGDAGVSQRAPQPDTSHDTLNVRSTVLETRKQRDEARRAEVQKRQIYDLDAIDKRMKASDAIGGPSDVEHTPARSAERKSQTDAREHLRPVPGRNSGDEKRPELSRHTFRQSEQDAPTLRGQVRMNPEPALGDHQPTEQLPIVDDNRQSRQSGNAAVPHLPFVHIDGRIYGDASLDESSSSTSTIVQPDANDPVDQQERLRTVTRCCGTCRDYRQVGDGSRGQCVNPYAFGDRRMVQSDQLACRSSLGMWWMPNDDVWLERADTSHHGRPTPLLDAAMRAHSGGETGRDSRQ